MNSSNIPSANTIDRVSWLMLVLYHSKSASIEDQKNLYDLAMCAPSVNNTTSDEKKVIQMLQNAAQTKSYNPAIPKTAFNALVSLKTVK